MSRRNPLETDIGKLVFCVFIKPRTQSEAVRLIYNTKNVNKVNRSAIINTIRKLRKEGYLRESLSEKLNSPRIETKEEALLNLIKDSQAKRNMKSIIKDKRFFTEDEEKAMLRILDSSWFRNFFSLSENYEIGGIVTVGSKVSYPFKHFVFRNSLGRLKVTNAVGLVLDVLDTIGAISYAFTEIPFIKKIMPPTSVLLDFVPERYPEIKTKDEFNFDTFSIAWEKN